MRKRIIIFFIVSMFLLENCVSAYFRFENTFNVFSLNRNKVPANVSVLYSNMFPTNQDVEVNIEFDKVISIIGDTAGMTFSEDGKKLTKTIEENESNTLLIRDEDYNYQEVIYNVNWIDKQPPIITGAEDGKIYNQNIHLDYSDNIGVKEIYSDYYSDNFSIYDDSYDFYETDNLRIVTANRNVIVAHVLSNPKEIEKYNYYIDGTLSATTHDKLYVFKEFDSTIESHHIVVEGLDRYGNVVDTKETYRRTLPVDGISIGNNLGKEYIGIRGVPEGLQKISAYIWVWGHADSMLKVTPRLTNEGFYLVEVSMANHKNYSGRYIVKFEMEYLENGITKTENIIGSFSMPNKFKELNYDGLPNDFTENGKYYIRCSDEAGNESEIEFEIRK